LFINTVVDDPAISATLTNVNGLAVVTVTNSAAAGNTATYTLDITALQSMQQGGGGSVGIVHVTGGAGTPAGLDLPSTDVNVANYPATLTDVCLDVRYTTTGAAGVTLPAIATVGPGKVYVVIDAGDNATVHNITVAPTGADKINNVAAPYTINVSGSAFWFKANTTTGNWEIV
jgi:hypothetical protein